MFWNDGRLPEGITLKSLKRWHPSLVLADVAFKGGYIDAWGRGTLKIMEACRAAGLAEPEMRETDGGFLVALRMKNKTGSADPTSNPISNPTSNADALTPQVGSVLAALQSGKQTGRCLMKQLSLKDYGNFKYSY